jgi:hypothetical protein
MPDRRWKIHAAALILLLIAVLVAFSDVIGPERGLFFRDHTSLFRPRWLAVWESLRSGRLPTLTHAIGGGIPLEASLNLAIYTPTTLLLLGGPFDVTYDLFVASHFFVLAAGAYGLAVSLGARPAEAFVGAAIASLSGPIISLENLLNVAQGMAYAPWVYWALASVLRSPSKANTGALALAIGFHGQGIMPELVLLDVFAALLLVLHLRPKPSVRTALALVAALALGAALASITLAPGLELLAHGRRGHGFSIEERTRWSLSFAQTLDLLAPSFWAPPDSPFLNVARFTGSLGGPWLVSLYFGSSMILVGISVSLLRSDSTVDRRLVVVLVGGALIFTLLATGSSTLFYGWISALPLFRSARYPVKYMVLVACCAAVLAPIALRAIERVPRRLIIAQAIALLSSALLCGVVSSHVFADWLHGVLTVDPRLPSFESAPVALWPDIAVAAMKVRALHGLSFSLIMFLIAIAWIRSADRSRLSMFIAATIGVDLAVGASYGICGAVIREPPTEAVERIASPYHRVFDLASWTALSIPRGGGGRTFFEDLVVADRARRLVLDPRVRRYDDPDPQALSNPVHAWAFEQMKSSTGTAGLDLLARAGVAYLETARTDVPLKLAFDVVVPVGPRERVYEIPRVRSYATAYTRWRFVRLADLTRNQLLAMRDTALVFEPVVPPISTSSCSSSATLAHTDSIERIEIESSSACPTVVVALEPVMPGWLAEVDGHTEHLVTSELGFLGAMVPAGVHRVVFEYIPRVHRWAPIALLAFSIAMALVFFESVRRRVRSRGPS